MRLLKRFAVTIAGVALLVFGAALMVLPGPGILGIVAGLAVLATEYAWAQRLLLRARTKAEEVQRAAVSSPLRTAGSALFALGMVALGIAMLVVDDLAWPALDATVDSVWGPVTGSVLIATGLILITTTYLTLRSARSGATPDPSPEPADSGGATRYQSS